LEKSWDDEGARPESEDVLLALINAEFPSACAHVPFGRGHDCAELAGFAADPGQPCLALSTDLFLQDIHFSSRYFLPEEAGGKALSAAVSDLAAAGAKPLGFSLGLMLPASLSAKTLSRIFSGMAGKAREYGLALSGGDLSRSDKIGFSITLWGTTGPGHVFLRRAAAKVGDAIFLIGEAGLAHAGLWALEKYGRQALTSLPRACLAHLDPKPLLREGQILAALVGVLPVEEAVDAISLMDVSDGLLRDIPRLLGGRGAALDFSLRLIPEEVLSAAKLMQVEATEIFLRGGEDYALLGRCKPDLWPRVKEALPGALLLGEVCAEPGIFLRGTPYLKSGFDHFCTGQARPVQDGELPEEINQAALEIIKIGRESRRAGFTSGFNSNISLRVILSDGREACLITRAGADKAYLTMQDLVLLSLDGNKISGRADASTESWMHLEIYRATPQSKAVLHSHPPCLLALSLSPHWDKGLDLPLPEVERFRACLALTPFFPPGTPELAAVVGNRAAAYPALWLERHGLVTHGPDLAYALGLTGELEQAAKISLLSHGLAS
jgi:thiamine-monophosphate kinase